MMWTKNFQMFKLDLEKAEEIEINWPTSIGSKLGKEYAKAVYCHPAYLTYMQNTFYEMLGWVKLKLESDCQEIYW